MLVSSFSSLWQPLLEVMLRTNTFVNAPNRLSSKCTWATWTNLNTENIKFSKDCFSNGMRVTSYGVKVGDYYLVQYSPMGYDNCTEYNVTRIEKYFELTLKDGFQRDLNYQLKVQAMQGNTILWRHTLNIGSCPCQYFISSFKLRGHGNNFYAIATKTFFCCNRINVFH
eukprot:TCONS_00036978-protein